MGDLKTLEKEITPKIFNNLIPDKNFFDSKQHGFFGRKTRLTLGQRAADALSIWAGSWVFISLFIITLIIWVWVNVYYLATRPFDPYPFILLNLF